MSSFWTFLVILGVVAIKFFGELATDKSADQPEAPTDEEKQDIERKIREILGDDPTEKRVVTTPAQPAPAAPKPAVHPARPEVKHQPAYTSLEQITPEIAMSSHRMTQPTPSRNTPSPKKPQVIPTEAAGKSELEAMIDDFTMEKAVIYSEILEPKFKQY